MTQMTVKCQRGHENDSKNCRGRLFRQLSSLSELPLRSGRRIIIVLTTTIIVTGPDTGTSFTIRIPTAPTRAAPHVQSSKQLPVGV